MLLIPYIIIVHLTLDGADITGITTNEKLADQYASNCTLALPFIGTSPVDVSASIACTTSTKTLGKNGTPTTDVSNFYASSPHLVGNSAGTLLPLLMMWKWEQVTIHLKLMHIFILCQ